MKIPTVAVPTYTMKLISTGKEITFRPFLVKEEKLLLLAAASKDPADILSTIQEIIKNCVTGDLEVKSLPMFDIKYILLNLRIRAIGKSVDVEYTCNHAVSHGEGVVTPCGHKFTISYDLEDIEVKGEGKQAKIMVGPNLGVVIKAPSFKATLLADGKDSNALLYDAIVSVFDAEKVYDFSVLTNEEKSEWIDSLPQTEFDKLIGYLSGLPKLEINREYVCEECGTKHDIQIKDFTSFF